MAIQLKYMEGKEFVRQALSGERDFSKTRLEEGFDLSGYESFDELQKYLKNQNLKEEQKMELKNGKNVKFFN